MQLLIFEKPKQARTVCEAFQSVSKQGYIELKPQPSFPKGAIAVWCVGHILEQKQPHELDPRYKQWTYEDLPLGLNAMNGKSHHIPLKVTPSKKEAFDQISKWLNHPNISSVVAAGDCAREGQLIVDEVLYFLNNKKPVKRLWINSLEKSAVRKGFENLKPNEDYHSYYEEALARQYSDYIIGMNISRAMTILLQDKGAGTKGAYSTGRCQTPLLRILYERDLAIKNFVPTPYYELVGTFDKDSSLFHAKYQSTERLVDKEEAHTLAEYLSNNTAIVDSLDEEKETIQPPLFFNLTSLMSEVNKKTGDSPERVLVIAQSLYEKGFISYPRADPVVVNPEEGLTFPTILQALAAMGWGANMLPAPIESIMDNKRYIDSDKTDDHYGIIPTIKVPLPTDLTEEEFTVYEMIAERLITAHYPPAINSIMKASLLVDDEFTFGLKEKRSVELGWKAVAKHSVEDNTEDSVKMPPLVIGESIPLLNVETQEKMTTAPKRFTQGQLPTIMANISSYLADTEKEGLQKSELSLGTVATRSNIIEQLKQRDYISIKKNLVYVEPKGRILISSLGPKSWIASPRTTGEMEKYLNQVGLKKQPAKRFVDRTCQLVTELVNELKDSAPGWQLDQSDVAAVVKTQKSNNVGTSIGACFLCDGEVMDFGSFYGCSNYKETECPLTISKKISGKVITKTQVIKILQEKKTDILTDFISKQSKPFSAQLIWNDEKRKLVFSFPPK
ncbi:MAG: DNA topoisomerase [Paenisporosarcina sp.]|nr:DNA topoisomerase [Paenisporosarcina sp.]